MIRGLYAAGVALAAVITPVIGARAQAAPPPDSTAAAAVATPAPALRVYLDCRTWGCDRDLFITEVRFATLTRDRADADVQLLVTALGTGGGGRQITLQFIGLRAFEGRTDTVTTSLPPNVADDRTRREIIRVAKLGLVRYALGSSVAAGLRLDDAGVPAALRDATLRENDPWDFWVISVGASGGSSAESRSSRGSAGASLNARRVTDEWKINVASNGNYRQSTYELTDSTTSTYILRDYGARGRIVRNNGPHWSMGAIGNLGHTDYSNQDTYARLGATFEYSIFPWSQATSRQLVAAWSVAVQHFDYHETTIYDKDHQTLSHQQAIVAGTTRQPWGNVDMSIRWSQYLTDRSKNFLGLNGNASLRITRGLALNFGAYANRVRDQLYLPRGEATSDEILTQQRALATSFTRGGSLSVSYTFGSIYNTIVNPRLDVLGGF
ncbi:MAG: hypothetical protein ACYC3L_15130 [Gemmatimonadaceae bacterium]